MIYLGSPLSVYIFHRKEGFYPVELDNPVIEDHAICNPGTLKITDIDGNVLWSKQ